MTENPKSRRARDAGAPDSVEASHTVPGGDPELATVQDGVVNAHTVRTSLPIGADQVDSDPGALAAFTGSAAVPTAAPSGAPSGSTWTDEVDRQPSQANESTPGPRLAYVVTWAKAAVHVNADAAQQRGEGDELERYIVVQSAAGTREAVLEGQQVTLERGEVLPDEAAEGQGAFLVSIGGAVPVSVPASSPAS